MQTLNMRNVECYLYVKSVCGLRRELEQAEADWTYTMQFGSCKPLPKMLGIDDLNIFSIHSYDVHVDSTNHDDEADVPETVTSVHVTRACNSLKKTTLSYKNIKTNVTIEADYGNKTFPNPVDLYPTKALKNALPEQKEHVKKVVLVEIKGNVLTEAICSQTEQNQNETYVKQEGQQLDAIFQEQKIHVRKEALPKQEGKVLEPSLPGQKEHDTKYTLAKKEHHLFAEAFADKKELDITEALTKQKGKELEASLPKQLKLGRNHTLANPNGQELKRKIPWQNEKDIKDVLTEQEGHTLKASLSEPKQQVGTMALSKQGGRELEVSLTKTKGHELESLLLEQKGHARNEAFVMQKGLQKLVKALSDPVDIDINAALTKQEYLEDLLPKQKHLDRRKYALAMHEGHTLEVPSSERNNLDRNKYLATHEPDIKEHLKKQKEQWLIESLYRQKKKDCKEDLAKQEEQEFEVQLPAQKELDRKEAFVGLERFMKSTCRLKPRGSSNLRIVFYLAFLILVPVNGTKLSDELVLKNYQFQNQVVIKETLDGKASVHEYFKITSLQIACCKYNASYYLESNGHMVAIWQRPMSLFVGVVVVRYHSVEENVINYLTMHHGAELDLPDPDLPQFQAQMVSLGYVPADANQQSEMVSEGEGEHPIYSEEHDEFISVHEEIVEIPHYFTTEEEGSESEETTFGNINECALGNGFLNSSNEDSSLSLPDLLETVDSEIDEFTPLKIPVIEQTHTLNHGTDTDQLNNQYIGQAVPGVDDTYELITTDNRRTTLPGQMNQRPNEFERNRMTYTDWPQNKPPVAHMAEAGLLYTGQLDRVRCTTFGCTLEQFEKDDNPTDEHAFHFPYCPVVRRTLGDRAIQELLSQRGASDLTYVLQRFFNSDAMVRFIGLSPMSQNTHFIMREHIQALYESQGSNVQPDEETLALILNSISESIDTLLGDVAEEEGATGGSQDAK